MRWTNLGRLALAPPLFLAGTSVGAGPDAPAGSGPRSAAPHADPQGPPPPPPRPTAPALAQEAVDFNHPPREYLAHRLQGWDVLVEEQLHEEAPGWAEAALARLDECLGVIARALPAASLGDLRRVKIFLMLGSKATKGGRGAGLEYFRRDAAEHHAWIDPRMASSIVIFSAENYASLSDLWARKSLMHEFGHAQHLEHWPESRADIFDAWDAARDAGRYGTVRKEDEGTHNPNYAARNHLEYFAELSTTYFVGNSYFPRDRAALKDYDPAGYALVEALWGIGVEAGSPRR